MLTVVALHDEAGRLLREDLLAAALPVHRQLRPNLPDEPAAYRAMMARVFAGGARMFVALDDADQVQGVALWRVYENTYQGRRLYLDDLVTGEAHRSQGVGKALLAACEAEAARQGCGYFSLDSGTWRTDAHRFYFREGFTIQSFHFVRPLG
ncbi:GNAT family N-acetyltransferase [Crenobacter caeni]|uniref:GNAT family N-acetyltransferase n=1 Tax=Crenobacter caeni TaxID=2705474 RepID=UPI00193EE57D|nr:GNAT family N-acetyltransferase [Crenobacter caeni]